jgi:hypothetical protein
MRYQQNLSGRKIAVVVVGLQQWPRLRPHVQRVVEAVNASIPGSFTEIDLPRDPRIERPEHGIKPRRADGTARAKCVGVRSASSG